MTHALASYYVKLFRAEKRMRWHGRSTDRRFWARGRF